MNSPTRQYPHSKSAWATSCPSYVTEDCSAAILAYLFPSSFLAHVMHILAGDIRDSHLFLSFSRLVCPVLKVLHPLAVRCPDRKSCLCCTFKVPEQKSQVSILWPGGLAKARKIGVLGAVYAIRWDSAADQGKFRSGPDASTSVSMTNGGKANSDLVFRISFLLCCFVALDRGRIHGEAKRGGQGE